VINLYKFLRLPFQKKMLCLEAAFFLLTSRLALQCLPFRLIQRFMNRAPKQPQLQGEERKRMREDIRWVISGMANHLPGETVCFPQGLAAQEMLRRRNIGTTLYFGATAKAGISLKSHVWVQDGEAAVIGCRGAAGYKIVAKFPNVL